MIAKEVAQADIERFMTAFKVDPIKRKKIQETINECVELVEAGMLLVNSDNKLVYLLLEPICDDAGKVLYDKIVFYNKRIRVEEIKDISVLSSETDQVKKIIAKITDFPEMYVGKLTVEDLGYVSTISSFFMPAQ